MNTKHTPGKWVVFEDNEIPNSTYGIDAEDGTAVVFFGIDQENGIRNIHDAYLIAAAPDGIAAAIKALNECVDLIGTPAGDALQAFINKATGDAT